jgi:hypothetical protein
MKDLMSDEDPGDAGGAGIVSVAPEVADFAAVGAA